MHVEDVDARSTFSKVNMMGQSRHTHRTEASHVSALSVANSLREERVTYKYKEADLGTNESQRSKNRVSIMAEQKDTKGWILSFSIIRAWEQLSQSKCKKWDDRELDVIEGIKFFSFFLGQLCLTAEFLMCT